MQIFPTDAVTTVITGFTDIVSNNIAVPLGVFAALFGVSWVLRRLNHARNGRL